MGVAVWCGADVAGRNGVRIFQCCCASQIIVLNIESVQTSCGYAVPQYDYRGEREVLMRWAEKKGTLGLAGILARKPDQH